MPDYGNMVPNPSSAEPVSSGKKGILERYLSSRRSKKSSSGSNGGDNSSDVDSYKRGGKVRKTGLARLHEGEVVLTKTQARKRKRGRMKSRS